MNQQSLKRLIRLLRLTETQEVSGEHIAALTKANALMRAEGFTWSDLLGGDPDSSEFPQHPPWLSTSGLSQDEMQALFDAGYHQGLRDGKEAHIEQKRQRADELFNTTSGTTNTWSGNDIRELIERARRASIPFTNLLSEFETSFLASYNGRLQKWGSPSVSPKQAEVLNCINDKLKRHLF